MHLTPKALLNHSLLRVCLGVAALLVATEIVIACGSSTTTTSTTTTTGTGTGTSTASVDCSYTETTPNSSAALKITSMSTWSCTSTERLLSANGIPDHSVGTFPNSGNPNTITAQSVNWYTSISPANTGTQANVAPSGYALNGVKFDPGTAGNCPTGATSTSACSLLGTTGAWTLEALGQTDFDFGVDSNNAHVQPNGAYHYHGMPTGILTNNKATGQSMLLVGWAADGFPIYARWGYTTATDASSAIKVITSSYSLKSTPDSGRPSTSIFPMGTFTQDYQYVAGSGDLDACNGRTGVTPEFPKGIYHYYITDTYPFIQRCVFGTTLDTSGM
jgi:hypothetical protein